MSATTRLPSLYDLTRPQWGEFFAARGFSPSHAAPLWRYLYRDLETDFAAMSELPSRLRERLSSDVRRPAWTVVREETSDDESTRKFLLGLDDGVAIETVLMRSRDRSTACVSSQVGCAVGCVFCATGQAGFSRNLTAGEIVAQALFAERVLRQAAHALPNGRRGAVRDSRDSLRNIVVMGMGEPLLNYDPVMNALEILRDPGGIAIGAKRITLSTVGVVPGIVRLADEGRPYSLAVSLHAATQNERAALVPAAKAWPLAELIDACRYYATKLGRKIFFEWTLIAGVNDSVEQATALVRLLTGISAQVNLIPLNTTPGYDGTSGHPRAYELFRETLAERGVPVSIRRRRGTDIAAGCGQLAGA